MIFKMPMYPQVGYSGILVINTGLVTCASCQYGRIYTLSITNKIMMYVAIIICPSNINSTFI